MAAPAAPQGLTAQPGSLLAFLSWTTSSGAASYSLERSTDGSTYSVIASPTTASYFDDSDLTNGTLYYYRVKAVNVSAEASGYSSVVTVVPVPDGAMSLGQLRLASQQRADRVGSNFVTTSEWNSYINQSYMELYDLLVTLYEDYYLAAPLSIPTTGSTQLYPLPDGTLYSEAPAFYKLLGVDLGVASGSTGWVSLRKFDFISRNRYVFPNLNGAMLGVAGLSYRIVGSNLMIIPTASGGQTIRLWYIPRLTPLLQDTDIADGVSGWLEYVIVDAAIKALQKEESDVSVLFAQKAALRLRIEESGMNRDAGQPDKISDTRGESVGGTYGSPTGDGSSGGW